MNVAGWNVAHAGQYGDEIALIGLEESITNAQLFDRCRRLARALLELGAKPGDRVAITMPNCVDLYVAADAAYYAGMVLVVLPDSATTEVARMTQHCGAKVLVARQIDDDSPLASLECIRIAGKRALSNLVERHAPLEHPVARAPDDIAQLCYTSGTTDEPKAAVYSHSRVDAYLRARHLAMSANRTTTCVLIAVPPTSFGARLMAMRVVAPQKYVLLERFEPAEALSAIERHSVNVMPLLPTMAEKLAAATLSGRYDCSSLGVVNISGAYVSGAIVQKVKETIHRHQPNATRRPPDGIRVIVHYGMTETGGGIASSEGGSTSGDGNVGRVVEGVTVRIVAADGTEAAAGKTGEIVASTPYAASGYWNDPDKSAAVFRDGYVRTGDLGCLKDNGELCIVGRVKDVIVQGGVKVMPAELVGLIGRLPGVEECAVIGTPDELMGEEVVACIVRSAISSVSEREVLAQCSGKLDPRKWPGQVQFFDRLPRTVAGKVETRTLQQWVVRNREAALKAQQRVVSAIPPRERVAYVRNAVIGALCDSRPGLSSLSPGVDDDIGFDEVGLDSLAAVRLAHKLSERLGLRLAATAAYTHPTVSRLCRFVESQLWSGSASSPKPSVFSPRTSNEAIAIVGIGCRVPGANSPDEFWKLLEAGRDSVRRSPEGRSRRAREDWVGGFLDRAGDFDGRFFMLEGHAARIDPRHRMVLEVAWEGCEDAGQNPLTLPSHRTGVFLGIYAERYESPDPLGRAPGMAVGYLCQFLDLRGPAFSVDTTCSSSLVAVHNAVTSLQRGECEIAIAGGVSLLAEPTGESVLGVISADGRSRAFDAAANGFGPGEGCVLFVLKRLSDARAAGDRIYAAILGTAINHDGRSTSLTAPNPLSQEALIRQALSNAGVAPMSVQYVEAHGTGTLLGDPIEVEALARVFHDRAGPPLAIGSVKTNIGHLEAAAGAAGIAKVALSIAHGRLVPSLQFKTPNPHIPWKHIPIRVQTESAPWPNASAPRVAGVSSFGMSGTNAHAVLSEPPSDAAAPSANAEVRRDADCPLILPLSAKTLPSLRASAARWVVALENELREESRLDIASIAGCRRAHFGQRVAVIGTSHSDWIRKLRAFAEEEKPAISTAARGSRAQLVMVFGGQGVQWPGMGRELFDTEPVFRDALSLCAQHMERHLGCALLEELWRADDTSRLACAQIAQPALFAIQIALYELWKSWGVIPDAVVGHSLGEIAAACVAGVMSLEEGAHLVCERGRIVQQVVAEGAMMHVALDLQDAESLCAEYGGLLEVAATNGPRATTLSGDSEAVQGACEALFRQRIHARVLAIDRAYHSAKMEGARAALTEVLRGWQPREATIPLISTVTGERGPRMDAEYWGGQLRSRVRFREAISGLLDEGYTAFLEIGPHPALQPAIQSALDERGWRHACVAASMRRRQPERHVLAEALGRLYCAAVPVDWSKRYGQPRKVVSLPTYAWDHVWFWHGSSASAPDAPSSAAAGDRRRRAHPPIGEYLREMFSTFAQIPVDSLPDDTTPAMLGIDSLALMEIRSRLKSDLGVHLDPTAVGPHTSLGQVISTAAEQTRPAEPGEDSRTSHRLTWLRERGTQPTHVWIHPAGGGIDCYQGIAKASPCDAVAIEAMHASRSCDGTDSVESTAARYIALLREQNVRGPVTLGGWSFGGLVAYEMARQLRLRGDLVPLVIMIDSYVLSANASVPAWIGSGPHRVMGREPDIDAKREFLSSHSLSQLPHSLIAEDVERLYAVLRANLLSAEQYRPSRYDGAVLSIRASKCSGDPDAAWCDLARDFSRQMVAGDHYSIMQPPALESVARIVRDHADRIDARRAAVVDV